MRRGVSGEWLLQQPVLLRGIRIGRPIDLVLDLDGARVVGLELRCGDEIDRFLPYAVARVEEAAILVDSPLQLVEDQDLAFYRRRGTSLRTLRGLPVEAGETHEGTLADVLIGPGGALVALDADRDGERRRVPVAPSVSIAGRRLAPAA